MRRSTTYVCACWLALAMSACGGGEQGGSSFGDTGGASGDAGAIFGQGEILFDDASPRGSIGSIGYEAGVTQVSGGALDDVACASEVRKGEQTPLDLYIALDSSGSMTDVSDTSRVTKWKAVSDALVSFVNDQASVGLGVGLQYFPLLRPGIPDACDTDAACKGAGPCDIPHTCVNSAVVKSCVTSGDCAGAACVQLGGCATSGAPCAFIGDTCANNAGVCLPFSGYCRGRDVCEVAPYGTPDVPIGTLPGVAPAIVRSLAMHQPDGLTPTSSALAGALEHARAQALAHPDHRVVVVLATDGFPTECAPTDIASISRLAATAAVATPAISSFVIGVFSPDEAEDARSNLDAIAAAGGSNRALIVQTNQNVSQAFLQALDTIRTTALSCEYNIPAPQAGVLDYQSVNVRFTPSTGKTVTLGFAGDAAGCGAPGGWYYDTPLGGARAPSKIEMCPATCTTLKAETRGQVNVLFGCKTETVIR